MDLYSISRCDTSRVGAFHDLFSGFLSSLLLLTIGLGLMIAALSIRRADGSEATVLASYQPWRSRNVTGALSVVLLSFALGSLLLLSGQLVSTPARCGGGPHEPRATVVRYGLPAHYKAIENLPPSYRRVHWAHLPLVADLVFWSGLVAVSAQVLRLRRRESG